MVFAELWKKSWSGDTKASQTLHLYHYVIPHMARIFKRFQIEPPIVLPKPKPQPDPMFFERIAGEAQLFDELSRDKQIANFTAPLSLQLKILESLKSEILDWLNEIEKDIEKLHVKIPSKEHGVSDLRV